MRGFRFYRRVIAWPAAAVMLLASLPLATVHAGMVSTDRVIEQSFKTARADPDKTRERVMRFLKREDVREQMRGLGVDPDEAFERARVLSDKEIGRIAGKLDEMPAGGDAVGAIVGAIVLVFVVLLITDLLCWTKVFPFTSCISKK